MSRTTVTTQSMFPRAIETNRTIALALSLSPLNKKGKDKQKAQKTEENNTQYII